MLFELLERHAVDRPDQLALVCGDDTLTWRQFHDRTSRLASGLATLGLGPDSVVALVAPNSIDLVSAILALSRIGAQALLAPPDLKAPEIRQALEAAGCSITLDPPSLNRLTAESGTSLGPPVADDAPFLHLLTSGTTGGPKRVVRTQAALCALASAYCQTADLTSHDRTLCVIPLHHGHGLCAGLLAPLFSGSLLILEPRFERRAALRKLGAEAITTFSAPPFIFSILADSVAGEAVRLPDLRLAITAGAPLDRSVWTSVRDRLGIGLRQLYGASETGVVAMNMDADPEVHVESVGRPIAGASVAIGSEGKIAVKSPWTSTWSAPLEPGDFSLVRSWGPTPTSLTSLTPLADAEGWIHTADVGHVDSEGRLYVTGRTSRFINIAGRKVNPAEIEALLSSHPHVTSAVVLAMRDSQGNDAAKAVVYCSEPVPVEQLVGLCRERLAPYKVPRLIEIRAETSRTK